MNTAAARLALLRRRALLQEESAAAALAEALNHHANAEQRHAELLRYEAEYAAQELAQGAGVLTLRQRSAFVARLREAVQFQAQRAQLRAQELEQARRNWLELHREVEKLDRLSEQLQLEQTRIEVRRQSREMDEFALRRHTSQQSAGRGMA